MLHLVVSDAPPAQSVAPDAVGDHGVWTGYEIPEDRAGWHPLVGRFYEYWLSAAPAGRLPGRQHIRPEEIPGFLSRLWMLDVCREPLRYRYRLCGTELVRSLGREVTGRRGAPAAARKSRLARAVPLCGRDWPRDLAEGRTAMVASSRPPLDRDLHCSAGQRRRECRQDPGILSAVRQPRATDLIAHHRSAGS